MPCRGPGLEQQLVNGHGQDLAPAESRRAVLLEAGSCEEVYSSAPAVDSPESQSLRSSTQGQGCLTLEGAGGVARRAARSSGEKNSSRLGVCEEAAPLAPAVDSSESQSRGSSTLRQGCLTLEGAGGFFLKRLNLEPRLPVDRQALHPPSAVAGSAGQDGPPATGEGIIKTSEPLGLSLLSPDSRVCI